MSSRLLKYLIASVLMLGNGSGYADDGQALIDPDLQAVAETYFAALSSGDTQALLSLFAEHELLRSEGQLSDPDYPEFLASRYSSARLEVLDSGVQGELAFVDIKIWMNDIEAIKERLILRTITDSDGTSYRIIQRE